MGHHRAEPPAHGQATPHEVAVSPRAGRRRADVPVDSLPGGVPAPALPETRSTSYAGRRVAVLDRPVPVPVPPVAPVAPTPAVAPSEDTIAQVLSALEPVDHTTSFEHEPTERLPLIRFDQPPPVERVVQRAAQPAVQSVGKPAVQPAGRRRAPKRPTRRPPILKALPSVPVLLGLAALAVSVGGTLVVQDAKAAGSDTVRAVRPASALTGTSSVGHVGARGSLVTRDSDRQVQAQAGTDSPLAAAANRISAQRNTALQKFDRQSAAYAKVLASNQWITPVTQGVYHLTARFGQYGLWSSFHTGLDFAAPTGTPIHAIASGTVIFAQYDGAYGNKTIVRLPDGTELWYCHQNEFGTAVGDTVTQGETIGYVGSTGHTTGPHVHIEVHPGGGDPVDPFPAFVEHGITP